jgi:glycosyltransferase involved in cell wall biosynthesis
MYVSGFTFIRNAIIYDYPIVEAIQSILPLCDEVVVAVGKSEDSTLELIQQIDPKVRIIETVWDDSLREGGRVLAVETDKALAAISPQADWCFYIQGDEVLHEDGVPQLLAALRHNKNRNEVDGLLFKYLHFYGSYDYVGASANWYRHEIRVFKNNRGVFSFQDAQGFKKKPHDFLRVVDVPIYMHHYGWVKDPRAMQRKQEQFNKLWHDDQWVKENVISADSFDYGREVKELKRFSSAGNAKENCNVKLEF